MLLDIIPKNNLVERNVFKISGKYDIYEIMIKPSLFIFILKKFYFQLFISTNFTLYMIIYDL